MKSEREPVTSITALVVPLLFNTSIPSVSLHDWRLYPISNFLNVLASITSLALSVIIISLKELVCPSEKTFKANAIFSAVSFKTCLSFLFTPTASIPTQGATPSSGNLNAWDTFSSTSPLKIYNPSSKLGLGEVWSGFALAVLPNLLVPS